MQTSSRQHHLVEQASRGTAAVMPALAIAAGSLLALPLIEKRTQWRLAAASAGGILVYAGIAAMRTRKTSSVQFLRESITIKRSPLELTAFWRTPAVLNHIMQPFASAIPDGPGRLRWRVDVPVVGALSGEAVQVKSRPGELVHWRTGSDSPLQIDEWLRVQPAAGGAEAILEYRVDYSRLPAGALLAGVASFLHAAPEAVIRSVLHNFKSLAEHGLKHETEAQTPAQALSATT